MPVKNVMKGISASRRGWCQQDHENNWLSKVLAGTTTRLRGTETVHWFEGEFEDPILK